LRVTIEQFAPKNYQVMKFWISGHPKREEMGRNMNSRKIFGVILLMLLLLGMTIVGSMNTASAYAPQNGDYFRYSESTVVNNGQGSYTGYTDQTQTTGTEQIISVNGSLVHSSYSYSYQYTNNQGSSTANTSSGNYTWSSSTFTYVNGTDNQLGFGGLPYSNPLYVWFAMNPSLSVGSTFYILNTQFTVLSKDHSLQLPTENRYVQTIQTEGTGQYQRNDSYGIFTASYTWYEYFDPATGYIVGYTYVEQDNGNYHGQVGSFTYTDDLYITSTSYPLVAASISNASVTASTTSNHAVSGAFPLYLDYAIAAVVILLIVVIGVYAATRKRKRKDSLPKHSPTQYTPPPSNPPPTPSSPKIDLGSKPPEQVVIRDVAKVNCKYCGTLIPSTADTCPYCGAPRQ
jgi:hypothetical protein